MLFLVALAVAAELDVAPSLDAASWRRAWAEVEATRGETPPGRVVVTSTGARIEVACDGRVVRSLDHETHLARVDALLVAVSALEPVPAGLTWADLPADRPEAPPVRRASPAPTREASSASIAVTPAPTPPPPPPPTLLPPPVAPPPRPRVDDDGVRRSEESIPEAVMLLERGGDQVATAAGGAWGAVLVGGSVGPVGQPALVVTAEVGVDPGPFRLGVELAVAPAAALPDAGRARRVSRVGVGATVAARPTSGVAVGVAAGAELRRFTEQGELVRSGGVPWVAPHLELVVGSGRVEGGVRVRVPVDLRATDLAVRGEVLRLPRYRVELQLVARSRRVR